MLAAAEAAVDVAVGEGLPEDTTQPGWSERTAAVARSPLIAATAACRTVAASTSPSKTVTARLASGPFSRKHRSAYSTWRGQRCFANMLSLTRVVAIRRARHVARESSNQSRRSRSATSSASWKARKPSTTTNLWLLLLHMASTTACRNWVCSIESELSQPLSCRAASRADAKESWQITVVRCSPNSSARAFASVVLPLREHPEIPIMSARLAFGIGRGGGDLAPLRAQASTRRARRSLASGSDARIADWGTFAKTNCS
mmetsp:Transcript_31398/g.73059  ORF Transcript_31398/g.73059 Transcript_31398/m.73059 type:complete len:259 (+) Transcript_31398:1200-1976(+)